MRSPIHGHCEPAFSLVAEAFAASFAGSGQVGVCGAVVVADISPARAMIAAAYDSST